MRTHSRRAFVSRLAVLGVALPLTSITRHVRLRAPRRIGFITGNEPSLVAAFNDALRALGYVPGENLIVETRLIERGASNTAALPEAAAALARSDLDFIVAGALPYALEIRKANPVMPMVIVTCPGMVSNGFARTLEHPGGNATGIDELPPGVTAKRLTLLKAAAPAVSRIALLSTTPGVGGHELQLADAEQTASTLGVSVKVYRVTSPSELQPALASMVADSMNGLANFQGGLSLASRQVIVDFAATHRLPAVYQATLFAEAGGLMTWAPDLEEQYRIAAEYVDKILKGAKPGDLAIRFPARYYLTVNASAARGLGLTLPKALLAQADRVLA